MINILTDKFVSLIFQQDKKLRSISFIIVFVVMIGEYMLVYLTGGSRFSYTHMMYIPILIAGVIFGFRGGIFFGMIAGILLGPLMPLNTLTGEQQIFSNWFFRFSMFTVIGSVSGIFSVTFRNQSKKLLYYMTTHRSTGIKLAIFDDSDIDVGVNWDIKKDETILVICIMNFDNLIDLLGKEEYNKIFKGIYQKLIKFSPLDDSVLQYDIRSFVLHYKGENVEELAQIIGKSLTGSFNVNDIPIYIQSNIGISYFNDDLEQSIFNALTASRQAELYHLDYAIFDSNEDNIKADFEVLGAFLTDFRNDKTRLVYQPIIDLNTKKVVSVEALSRWENEIKGEMSPNYFIPLIEDTQIINELTHWVLDKAIEYVKNLNNKGINISVSLNISTNNLMSEKLIDYIIKRYERDDFNKGNIIFEITETTLMNNPEKSLKIAEKFKALGISFNLDDFGTGYSSLSYLSNFPIDKVKIDKSFILNMKNNKKVYDIVESSIIMSHKLGFLIIAEGVEDIETETLLKKLNCDFVQGFLYSKPIEEADFEKWYNNRKNK